MPDVELVDTLDRIETGLGVITMLVTALLNPDIETPNDATAASLQYVEEALRRDVKMARALANASAAVTA